MLLIICFYIFLTSCTSSADELITGWLEMTSQTKPWTQVGHQPEALRPIVNNIISRYSL